jgi:predicted amidohydrolase YtcJ
MTGLAGRGHSLRVVRTVIELTVLAAGALLGGGSDHMQKVGSLRSINPYNPWLGMWVTLTRKARWYDGQLHPEEAITREQAIRFYTINNARLLFLEDRVGSLEEGKLADFVVLDGDPLTEIADTLRIVAVTKGGVWHDRSALLAPP